jgi:hypothetical protein
MKKLDSCDILILISAITPVSFLLFEKNLITSFAAFTLLHLIIFLMVFYKFQKEKK